MRKFILAIFISLSVTTFAQFTYQGPAEGSIPSGFVHTIELGQAPSQTPVGKARFFLHNKPNVAHDIEKGVDLSLIGRNYLSLDKMNSLRKTDANEVVEFKSFKAVSDNGYIPPDPYLAVGPEHIINAVNTEFQILNKRGELLAEVDANQWYSDLTEVESLADPKIIYDQFSDKWVFVWIDIHDNTSEAYFIISVSDDSNPLGVWHTWWLPSHLEGSTPSGKWADYPGLGYDDKAIYLTSNQFLFGGGGQYPLIRIIPKEYIYANSGSADEVHWFDLWDIDYPDEGITAWGLRPVHVYGAEDDYYFIATRWWGDINTTVAIYRLKNPITTPELEAITIQTLPYEDPGESQQLGGGEFPIEHNGVRVTKEPVLRDGIMYVTHSAKYQDVIGFRYLTIDVTSEAAYTDYILGTDEHFHLYPAIAVNSQADAVITYTRSSANEYAGAFYTVIDGSTDEPIGTYQMQQGLDNYVKDYGTQRNRWGDYMGAYVDPTDDYSFWMHTQYVYSKNTWGTWNTAIRPSPFQTPYVKTNSPQIDFGLGEKGTSSEPIQVKITNLGVQELVISNLSLDSQDFSFENEPSLPISVATLDTLKLNLLFTPQSHGDHSDTLRIISNSQLSYDNKVSLSGQGYEITQASQNVMYASTGRGGGSLGTILTIDLATGAGTNLEQVSGYKPLRSITLNPNNNELVALFAELGNLPVFIRLRASDGVGYQYKQSVLDLNVITFDDHGVLHGITKDNRYYIIDYETMDTTFVGEVPIDVTALTFNPFTNELFATSSESSLNDRIYKLTATGDTVLAGMTVIDKTFEAIAFADDGTLYGAAGRETQNSTFYSFDPQTFEATEIGGVNFRGVLGLTFVFDPAVSVEDKSSNIPEDYALGQNYPNPFNPSTTINFSLPENSNVNLTIYNLLGEVVEVLLNTSLPAGYHSFVWNAGKKDISSGVYVYSLQAEGKNGIQFNESKKMVLVK